MNLLKKLGNCCNPCKDPQIVNVPGEKGDPGNDGAPGEDGINAFTLTTADFIMPASGANVDVEVGSALWMAGMQIVFIENAGYFDVIGPIDSTTITLQNRGDVGNTAPTTVIPANSDVAPAGPQGPAGSSGSGAVVEGEVAIPDAVSFLVVTGQAFGAVPSRVVAWIAKPVGGLNLVGTLEDGSLTNDGFTVYFNGTTDSANYKIAYIVVM